MSPALLGAFVVTTTREAARASERLSVLKLGGSVLRDDRSYAAAARFLQTRLAGFLGVSAGGAIASLGRGGSDLTAVLLAAAVRADACELVKDVPGYFTADPHRRADARPIRDLGFTEAIAMADAGCDLVQRAALVAADTATLRLVIRSMDAAAPVTTVHAQAQSQALSRSRSSHGVRHQDDPRRPAVGA
jgi:aspartate kinase